ncbi:NADH-quinone oxidoreductase subunit C [Streptomyces sp. NPDC004327]|uniref:NADH-quinone oxidoreductase subunit C n=1 Tax=Streptomyces sp. NPDC004327 TaxID=3364699 RepID=UPI00369A0648
MSDYFADAYAALPDSVTELFGEEATAERAYELLTVDVPTASWIAALEIARDKLGLTYFDWLSAVDEPGTGFRVCAHVASVGPGGVRRLLLRTTVPHAAPSLPSAIAVYAGAAWHERETYEMFGVTFTDHPHLVHLLLPENFEGHPLRKDFVLAARVAKAWPGAKEPGESHDPAAPKRRQMLPPGVPDPNDWGPLKGQLPPAPSRPARAAAGDRPVRRARTAADGSAGQTTTPPEATPGAPARRARSASAGSASQRTETPAATEPAPDAPTPPAGPRRARSVSAGSASQRTQTPAPAETPAEPASAPPQTPPAGPRRSRSASAGSASQRDGAAAAEEQRPAPAPARSADAPWHHARPAFDEEAAPESAAKPEAEPDGEPEAAAPKSAATPEAAEPEAAPDGEADAAEATESEPPTTPEPPAGGDPA